METLKMEPSARETSGAPGAAANQATNQTAYTTSGFAHSSRSPSDGQGAGHISPIPAGHSLPHGYNHAPPVQNEAHIHPELRSSTDAPAPSSAYPAVPIPSMMPASLSPPDQPPVMPGPATAIGGPPGAADQGDYGAEGRKAKRELSQSKRAAQNRAAQRAFRQRKEGYIKKLEQQVREYGEKEETFKSMQAEYHALRDYVTHLQSLLLDTKGEYPPPPANVNLGASHGIAHPAYAAEATPSAPGANAIDVAAQAVAGLNRSDQLAGREYKYEQHRMDDDARTAEELTRQLAESPDGLPSAPI